MSCVVLARSASAAAASLRSTRSSSTQRPRAWTSGRASAARRAISAAVSSTSSNTTDQRTLLSWWAPTCDSPAGSANSRSVGLGRRAGQRRHPHLEPGRLQLGAVDGHQLPRLVLAQHDLAPAHGPGPEQDGQQPLEPDQLVGQRSGRAAVAERHLDGQQLPRGARAEHREEPGAAGVRRFELHDEAGPARRRHRPRPLLEPAGHLAGRARRDPEGGAVEAGGEGLGHRRRWSWSSAVAPAAPDGRPPR